MPRAVHPHVRTQDQIAREPHQQVLAARIDALDRAAPEGRGVIDTRQLWKNGFEAGHRAARKRFIQRARRTKNGVAFRHQKNPKSKGIWGLFINGVVAVDVGEGAVGIEIAVVRVDYESVGVDVPGDVARVEAELRR